MKESQRKIVISQMGIVEELGSGMRKMFKYTPLYANGKVPIIEEQDVYRIEIPYIPTLQGRNVDTTQKSTQKSTQKILDLIRENPYVTTQEMVDSIDFAFALMLLTCEDIHVTCMANYIIEVCSLLFEVGPTIYIQFNTPRC